MKSRDVDPDRRHHHPVTTIPANRTARMPATHLRAGLGIAAVATVWVLGLTSVVLEVALSGGDALREIVAGFSFYGYVALVAYGLLGTALVRFRPHNALGWVALGAAAAHGLAMASGTYGLLAEARGWGGAAVATWVGGWVWVAGYWLIPTFLLLIFPDGHLPSRRWRPVAWLGGIGLAVSMLGWATLPFEQRDVPIETDVVQPLVLPFAGWLLQVGGVIGLAVIAACIASLVVRHRRAAGAARLQVRWALLGGAATVVLLVGGFLAGTGAAGSMLRAAAMVPLPASIAVGVLRHRLWDVDVVINRSLVYGVVTLAVLGTYVATVSLLGGLLGRGTGAPLLATALVAVGVNPVRVRIQRWVNEALYGQRDDPSTVLAKLVERLDAADGSASAVEDVAETVRRVLHGAYAAVEVGGGLRSEAGTPPDRPEDVVVVPLRVRGEPLGTLRFAPQGSGEPLDPSERRLLDDLARHIAMAVHTEQLTADLQDSRRALVEAREEERRRIRRDLHDGLGPTLASVAMRIEQASAGGDAAGANALDGLPERVREAVRSVRSLVEDLRPAALDELGLPAALDAQVRQFADAGLAIDSEIAEDLGPLSAAVDVACYRIVSEALTNVARHAAGSPCRVAVTRHGDALHVEVADAGVGLSDDAVPGVGLRSMRERAAEVGGTCTIGPDRGGGTVVRALLPAGG